MPCFLARLQQNVTSPGEQLIVDQEIRDRFQLIHEIILAAKENLSPGPWGYLMGSAETETTFFRNRRALDSLAFLPRVLIDVDKIDASSELFGIPLRLPLILAPIGSLEDIVQEGGTAPTRAAADFGVLHMLSSVAVPGLEKVAAAVDYPKLFQLYVRGDPDWVDDILARAIDHGYRGLCLTVDRAYYGRRERDLARRFKPTQRGLATGEIHQARLNWKDIDRIRGKFDVPLILKGISTVTDANLAVEHGVDVVYVSNHGGRQLDHSVGTMDILPDIKESVGSRAKIIVDGGFLRGTDIVKALALGADLVGLGRLQGLAAGAAGTDGITRMLEILEEEVKCCLGLLGAGSVADLNKDHLTRTEPLPRTGYDSAFPLLEHSGNQIFD